MWYLLNNAGNSRGYTINLTPTKFMGRSQYLMDSNKTTQLHIIYHSILIINCQSQALLT